MYLRRTTKRWHIARRGVMYSLVLCALILAIGGIGFWLIDPNVHTVADGLWLAFTTAATVGYGDVVPSTGVSRAFSVLVVLLGLAVLSLVTASLAANFVERDVEQEGHPIEHELIREINLLREDVRVLRTEVRQLRVPAPAPVAEPKSEPR